MSENPDLVRSTYANWERDDYSSAEWAHPDVEFVSADGPSPGAWSGHAGMAEGFRDFLSAWDEYRAEADEFCELDPERVLVLDHAVGRGRTSGLELGQTCANGPHLFHIRDGMGTRHRAHWNRERALSDLGLAPEADVTN